MPSKKSEKLHLIDQTTFKRIQENENKTSDSKKIKNAKFRKKHKNDENNFDLSAWMAATVVGRQRGQKAHAHYKKGATLAKQSCNIRKPGKVSENRRKKLTRLKKSILRYRVLKNQNECSEEQDFHATFGAERIQPMPEEVPVDIAMAVVEPLTSQLHKIDLNKTDFIKSFGDKNDAVDEIDAESKDPHKKMSVIADKLSNLTIHSRRFREYCDNCTTQDLAKLTHELLGDLNHFQRRAYAKNPVKANAHRRFVVGFRETQNHLNVKNKVKLVLIATDCEKSAEEDSIDAIIESIKSRCKTLEIPYGFSLDRRKLAYALHKRGIVSCVAILDYDGVREKLSQFLTALESARHSYQTATATNSTQ